MRLPHAEFLLNSYKSRLAQSGFCQNAMGNVNVTWHSSDMGLVIPINHVVRRTCDIAKQSDEPHREKTRFLPMRKQRRRSASR